MSELHGIDNSNLSDDLQEQISSGIAKAGNIRKGINDIKQVSNIIDRLRKNNDDETSQNNANDKNDARDMDNSDVPDKNKTTENRNTAENTQRSPKSKNNEFDSSAFDRTSSPSSQTVTGETGANATATGTSAGSAVTGTAGETAAGTAGGAATEAAAGTAASATGASAGTTAGATAGSAAGPIGTLVGAAAGALLPKVLKLLAVIFLTTTVTFVCLFTILPMAIGAIAQEWAAGYVESVETDEDASVWKKAGAKIVAWVFDVDEDTSSEDISLDGYNITPVWKYEKSLFEKSQKELNDIRNEAKNKADEIIVYDTMNGKSNALDIITAYAMTASSRFLDDAEAMETDALGQLKDNSISDKDFLDVMSSVSYDISNMNPHSEMGKVNQAIMSDIYDAMVKITYRYETTTVIRQRPCNGHCGNEECPVCGLYDEDGKLKDDGNTDEKDAASIDFVMDRMTVALPDGTLITVENYWQSVNTSSTEAELHEYAICTCPLEDVPEDYTTCYIIIDRIPFDTYMATNGESVSEDAELHEGCQDILQSVGFYDGTEDVSYSFTLKPSNAISIEEDAALFINSSEEYYMHIGEMKEMYNELLVRGYDMNTYLPYITDPDVLSYDRSNGILTALKAGTAIFSVTGENIADSRTIEVLENKVRLAIIYADNAIRSGMRYSSEKTYRMQEGFADSSSFVWRAYNYAGVNLGGMMNGTAPIAALIAKYLADNDRVIAETWIPSAELKPGDLIFYQTSAAAADSGEYTNVYKHICHTAMYMGNGKIAHALDSRFGVTYSDYASFRKNLITLIARPVR